MEVIPDKPKGTRGRKKVSYCLVCLVKRDGVVPFKSALCRSCYNIKQNEQYYPRYKQAKQQKRLDHND